MTPYRDALTEHRSLRNLATQHATNFAVTAARGAPPPPVGPVEPAGGCAAWRRATQVCVRARKGRGGEWSSQRSARPPKAARACIAAATTHARARAAAERRAGRGRARLSFVMREVGGLPVCVCGAHRATLGRRVRLRARWAARCRPNTAQPRPLFRAYGPTLSVHGERAARRAAAPRLRIRSRFLLFVNGVARHFTPGITLNLHAGATVHPGRPRGRRRRRGVTYLMFASGPEGHTFPFFLFKNARKNAQKCGHGRVVRERCCSHFGLADILPTQGAGFRHQFARAWDAPASAMHDFKSH